MPKVVQNLLETREVKLRRLLDQSSPNKTSSKHEKGIHHTTNSAENAETREQSGCSRSIVNTANTNEIGKIWMDATKNGQCKKEQPISGYRKYNH